MSLRSRGSTTANHPRGLNALSPGGERRPPVLALKGPPNEKGLATVYALVRRRSGVQFLSAASILEVQTPERLQGGHGRRRVPGRVQGRPRREAGTDSSGIYGERRLSTRACARSRNPNCGSLRPASALDDCYPPIRDATPQGRAISLELSDCTSWRDPAPTRVQRSNRSGPRAGRPARNPAVLQGG